MDTEQTLLEAIHAEPADETAWLALADRLEEQDDPRAELTRLWVSIRRDPGSAARLASERRIHGLLLDGLVPRVPTLTNSIGLELVLVPPGQFQMGSPDN